MRRPFFQYLLAGSSCDSICSTVTNGKVRLQLKWDHGKTRLFKCFFASFRNDFVKKHLDVFECVVQNSENDCILYIYYIVLRVLLQLNPQSFLADCTGDGETLT